LNYVLVDFKGGATFLGCDHLPHTAAVITNLEDEAALVERMYDAISGEMNRRQELLREAGNFANVSEYTAAREQGRTDLAPLPALVIVVDEFSELLMQHPDFAELFVAVGRLGRSLGVHLLLASQRLEEGRLKGLDSHLSYRIGLRTFSATESRIVLGVKDAYELPQAPGHGYLTIDQETMVRFRSSYVSGQFQGNRGRRSAQDGADTGTVSKIVPYTTEHQPLPKPPAPSVVSVVRDRAGETYDDPESVKDTLMDVLTERIARKGPPAHQV